MMAAAGGETEEMYDVMISYPWEKKSTVEKIAEFLGNKGLKVWIDDEVMKSGDNLYEKIRDGLKHSEIIIPCICKDYRESDNCKKELIFAISNLKKEKILPLYLDDTPKDSEVDFLVTSKLYIKFYGEDGKDLNEIEFDQQLNELYNDLLYMLKHKPGEWHNVNVSINRETFLVKNIE